MTLSIVLQFIVVLAAIWMGARFSGVGLGLWGAVGLLVLVVAFGVNPTSPPTDVMLIILAVIMAASVMDAAGGIDFLVRIAERIIRANPKYVTIVAPLTTWTFTFLAGTGHIIGFNNRARQLIQGEGARVGAGLLSHCAPPRPRSPRCGW